MKEKPPRGREVHNSPLKIDVFSCFIFNLIIQMPLEFGQVNNDGFEIVILCVLDLLYIQRRFPLYIN